MCLGRFDVELFRAEMEAVGSNGNKMAEEIGVQADTVYGWLRGTVPRRDNLNKIGEYFGIDPNEFLADGFDLGHSYFMGLMYKIFVKERKGDYNVKVSLTGLVRLGKELGVFKEPVESDLDLPDSILQKLLPQLEERARREAEMKVNAMADKNFLRSLVEEHRDEIKAMLVDEEGDENSE